RTVGFFAILSISKNKTGPSLRATGRREVLGNFSGEQRFALLADDLPALAQRRRDAGLFVGEFVGADEIVDLELALDLFLDRAGHLIFTAAAHQDRLD